MKANLVSDLKSQAGGALLAAMLVVAATSVGFAIWASILSQRGVATEAERGVIQRHIAQASSQSLLRSYLYEKGSASASGDLQDGGMGANHIAEGRSIVAGGEVNTWTQPLAMQSVNLNAPFNPFSPSSNSKPYSIQFSANALFPLAKTYPVITFLRNLGQPVTGTVQSRSPLLGNYQVVLHTSAVAPYTVTGNLEINGGLLAFPMDQSYLNIVAHRGQHFLHWPTGFTPKPSTAKLPSNLPVPSLTGGRISGNVNFDGQLDVIDAPHNGGNNTADRIATGPSGNNWNFEEEDDEEVGGGPANGTGVVRVLNGSTGLTNSGGISIDTATGTLTVNLNDSKLGSVAISNHITSIVFIGAPETPATQFMRSAIIVYKQDAGSTKDLTSITCSNANNSRRFLFCVKKTPTTGNGTNVNIAFPTSGPTPTTWRMITVAERTPLTFSATGTTGTITLTGGIQTNAPLIFPSGVSKVLVEREENPLYLERYTPRLAWVELQTI